MTNEELKLLTPQQQKQLFFDFEKRMQVWSDKTLYPQAKLKVDRSSADQTKDLILITEKGTRFMAEEKWRTSIYSDFLIELIQDVHTGNLGWFYKCRSKRIIYGMTSKFNYEAESPLVVFSVDMETLKRELHKLMQDGLNYRIVESKKGWGLSVNIAISWKDLKMMELAQEIYRDPTAEGQAALKYLYFG